MPTYGKADLMLNLRGRKNQKNKTLQNSFLSHNYHLRPKKVFWVMGGWVVKSDYSVSSLYSLRFIKEFFRDLELDNN